MRCTSVKIGAGRETRKPATSSHVGSVSIDPRAVFSRRIIRGVGTEGRNHGAVRPHKPVRFIRDGEGGESGIFISNTYS